jgi:phosphate transport system permease protein
VSSAESAHPPGLPAPAPRLGRPRHAHTGWRLTDRIGLGIAWALGLTFCALTAGMVLYLLFQGLRYVSPYLLFTAPTAGFTQSQTGGFLDPMIGTLLCALIAMAIALPMGIAVAVWLSEFARPAALARLAEASIEMLAGTPDIVLALFGAILFESTLLGFLSQTTGQVVLGRSFFAAGAMLSLVALPLIVGSVREGLQAIPSHVREASYAVGKSKVATIRRVLLPAARPSVVTGAMLGLGRVIGDTAIILVLLGSTLNLQSAQGFLGALRGQGSTMTSYIYANSPTGEGNQPTKAYAAAFVLLLFVLALNVLVEIAGSRSKEHRWS